MKLIVLSLFCIAMLSCKEAPKKMEAEKEAPEMVAKVDDSKYPEAMRKIFEAHGGLSIWKNKRTLSYTIQKPLPENHTIDLYSRDEFIETSKFSMGSKGTDIWLLDKNDTYKGDAVFYHNLMFYFYAMPFVLADDGINYSEAEPLEFEGTLYPGIRISYGEDVGLSPKDEYYIHYNAETFQMEWLGYTVTFRSGEKSENVKWIRYNDWMEVDDLVLPRSLTWHDYEGRTIKDARPPLKFSNIALSEKPSIVDFFIIPEGAKIVNSKME